MNQIGSHLDVLFSGRQYFLAQLGLNNGPCDLTVIEQGELHA